MKLIAAHGKRCFAPIQPWGAKSSAQTTIAARTILWAAAEFPLRVQVENPSFCRA
jgi:hypothetical protein